MKIPLRWSWVVWLGCLAGTGQAQYIIGTTAIDIDLATNIVTATCETSNDAETFGVYAVSVNCSVVDGSGNFVKNGSASDPKGWSGYAESVLTFNGIPGTTYIATGTYFMEPIIKLRYYYVDGVELDTAYDDLYFFLWFEIAYSDGQQYPGNTVYYGPGPETVTANQTTTRLGNNVVQLVVLRSPDHLQVVYDHTTINNACPYGSTRQRNVTYAIVDTLSIMVNQQVSILETIYPPNISTCDGSQFVTQFVCTPQPNIGSFTDQLNPGCPLTPQAALGCGVTVPDQKWEWCNPLATSPVSIGNIGPLSVFNTDINMGGNDTVFLPNTTFPK